MPRIVNVWCCSITPRNGSPKCRPLLRVSLLGRIDQNISENLKPISCLSNLHSPFTMDVSTHAVEDISELTLKEIQAYISGLLVVPNVQRAKKDSLVEYILAKAEPSCIECLQKAGQEQCTKRDRSQEEAGIGRKRKRNEQQNTHCVMQRKADHATEAHDSDSNQSDPSMDSFL